MTTLRKEKDDFRSFDFRPNFIVDAVAEALSKSDPLYEYKCVIWDYKHASENRVERYLNKGWEIVVSDQKIIDDRKNTPDNDSENKFRPSPVTKRTRDGYNMVLMRCLKTRRQENEEEKERWRQDRLRNLNKQHREKISPTEERVTEKEINTEKYL